jgi:hypothetical protein
MVPPLSSLLALLLASAVVSLAAAQPPIESSIGRPPVPPVVAMSAQTGSVLEDADTWRWTVTQGGLTLVCLVLVAVLYRELRAAKDDRTLLVTLVEKNTVAQTAAAEANNRLARALELEDR